MAQRKDIFTIQHNGISPEKGRILISEPFLQDSCFQRAVVYLIEHNAEGSMGFVINKKTPFFVNSFVPKLKDAADLPIYLGGPVSSNRLFFLHTLGPLIIPNTLKVGDDLFFDGDFDFLIDYIRQGNSVAGKVKFFLGYSGWSKEQLNEEVSNNSWLVGNRIADLFYAEGDDYWKDTIELLGEPYKNWTKFPKDPELN